MPINDVKSTFGLLFVLVAIERRKSGSREGTMNWSFGVSGVYGLPWGWAGILHRIQDPSHDDDVFPFGTTLGDMIMI